MPEEFLQYIWENNLFETEKLKTTDGQPVEIISTGKRNTDSGPDFFNARIKIDSTIWVGNVEIHRLASDWERHNHNAGAAYNSVIMHVAEIIDKPVFRSNGEVIPAMVLHYPAALKTNYQKLLDAKTWIACQNLFHKIDPIILQLGFNRLMIERLEDKTNEILARLQQNNNDWNETFYQMLARMFGFKVNSIPFEMLAKSLPIGILAKHKISLFQLEALLFGNSGLLNDRLLGDDYYLNLRNEYSFLYKKYQLKGIESHLWKFMRLRPGNFPTVRISQLAALIHRSHGLFSRIIEIESLDELKKLFEVQASDYWNAHYSFNKTSTRNSVKELGENSINTIIINVVIPFLFVYGEKQNKEYLKNRSLEFLEQLPSERNSIVEKWGKMGVESRSAFESQALLQLKNKYCELKKCLNCQIGVKLVRSN
ncbi:MAG: hypothetical protein FD181_2732 [Prolixibacteraceae bacterium]|mgnify:CR=1 FL=1|nr:MAG: hypothetical protein FD181_2732 [Prolixibacteraceae bacterium]